VSHPPSTDAHPPHGLATGAGTVDRLPGPVAPRLDDLPSRRHARAATRQAMAADLALLAQWEADLRRCLEPGCDCGPVVDLRDAGALSVRRVDA
jgi:hypothetical protein